MLLTVLSTTLSALFPVLVSAQTFRSVTGKVTGFLLAILPILATAAVAVFFYGLAEYVFRAGNQKAQEDAQNRIVAGLFGLFIIGALWGVVQLFGSTVSIL